ncbi:MAG: hypothetical protein IPJ46_22890 [Anaerolineales bacterium]|nr:hypothetical protein [Anaerolineales bacterium]
MEKTANILYIETIVDFFSYRASAEETVSERRPITTVYPQIINEMDSFGNAVFNCT